MGQNQQQQQSDTKVISVHGQLDLKRTLILNDPKLVRLYMTKEMYFKLTANAHYSQMTVDEYIRTVLSSHLEETS